MSWVRLDDKRAIHPKMMRAGILATGLDTIAICWCALHSSDGFISEAEVEGLWAAYGEQKRGKRGSRVLQECIGKLVEVERWERKTESGGYWIHDFLEYNQSRADQDKQREKTRLKVARWRERKEGRNPVTDGLVTSAVTLPPTRPDPIKTKTILSEIPSDPPSTNGKVHLDPAVEELCEYLSQRIGKYRGGLSKRPKVTAGWIKDMDLLLRRGALGLAEPRPVSAAVVRRAIAYVFDELAEPEGPKRFCWAANIQCPQKLREKWPSIADEKKKRAERSMV